MEGPHPDKNRRNIVRTKFLGHICSHLVGASLLRAICRTGGVIGDAPIIGGINDQTATVCYQERVGIINRHEMRTQTYSKHGDGYQRLLPATAVSSVCDNHISISYYNAL